MFSEENPKRLAQIALVVLLIIGCIAVLLPMIGAVLMVDMAHFAGLVAGKVFTGEENPVPYADVVASTTHKRLRGPRGGFLLSTPAYAPFIDKGCPKVASEERFLGKELRVKVVTRTSAHRYQAEVCCEQRLVKRPVSDVVMRRREFEPGF